MAQFDQYGRLVRKASNALPHYQAYTDWDILESSSSNDNWWTRLDNAVRRFGNWYDGFYPKITSFFAAGALGLGLLYLVILVVGTFAKEGILMGILSLIFSCIIGYIGFYVIAVIILLIGFIFWLFRWIVWNIYTLLATLIVLGIMIL